MATRGRTGPAGEQRDERGHQRDAGRGAVLRDRALGHVQVQVHALEERVLDAELARVRAHPGQRGLRALLHDVAELAGEGEALLAPHLGGLDVEHLAAGGASSDRPMATPGISVRSSISSRMKYGRAQELLDLLGRHRHGVGRALGVLARDLADDAGDLALEVAQAGLARVLADELLERLVAERDVLRRHAVVLELARDQVPARDVELLLLDVAGQADDLHAVAQRGRDGVEHVRGA